MLGTSKNKLLAYIVVADEWKQETSYAISQILLQIKQVNLSQDVLQYVSCFCNLQILNLIMVANWYTLDVQYQNEMLS